MNTSRVSNIETTLSPEFPLMTAPETPRQFTPLATQRSYHRAYSVHENNDESNLYHGTQYDNSNAFSNSGYYSPCPEPIEWDPTPDSDDHNANGSNTRHESMPYNSQGVGLTEVSLQSDWFGQQLNLPELSPTSYQLNDCRYTNTPMKTVNHHDTTGTLNEYYEMSTALVNTENNADLQMSTYAEIVTQNNYSLREARPLDNNLYTNIQVDARASCDSTMYSCTTSTSEIVISIPPLTEDNSTTPSTDTVHRCESCNRVFNKMCYLTQHNQTYHSGDKPLRCDRCGKRFSDSTKLENHRVKHTHDKPFKCSECSKSFNHQTDLRRHTLLHSSSKPYTCELCGKGFIRRDHMLKHVETHKKKSMQISNSSATSDVNPNIRS